MDATNPLIDDAFVEFLLYDVARVEELCQLGEFKHHSRETFDLFLAEVRRFARKELFASYKLMDEAPPVFRDGRVHTHPQLPRLWTQMVELGVLSATRPDEVGGVSLPLTVHTLASAYLMAGNPAVYGFAGLTNGAAHLIEAFGSDALKRQFMSRMYEGEWSGTMALTEPQAGSSLADIKTVATPTDGDHHLVRGSKIFISGGDHQATDNIVHLALARIAGAPQGSRGISLFAIPARRFDSGSDGRSDGELVSNDVTVAGMIHKIGWKGLPSLALEFGDRDDCHGYLVGEPNQGLRYMFQMMNEARIMVGVNGAATASVGYHEARRYALERRQGRPTSRRDGEPIPIIEHADVRRMLLRQKAIVEGSFALLATASRYADLASFSDDEAVSTRSRALLDLLTPIAKTFPAEKGFEANALAVQVHGGYGYSSEYLVEALLRDQKLNSLHEGTSGIQSLDLLGRKAIANGGAGLRALREEIALAVSEATSVGLSVGWGDSLSEAADELLSVTAELGARGQQGDVEGMLAHSMDYLEIVSVVVIGWQWLVIAARAKERLETDPTNQKMKGMIATAQYWLRTELPRVKALGELCTSCEDSYLRIEPECF